VTFGNSRDGLADVAGFAGASSGVWLGAMSLALSALGPALGAGALSAAALARLAAAILCLFMRVILSRSLYRPAWFAVGVLRRR
jgi:hypothetical protein